MNLQKPDHYTTWILDGVITAESPLATTLPNLHNARRSDLPTALPRMSIYTESGLEETVYFPGSGIRGKLRRCARDIVRTKVIEESGNPTPFSIMTHYYLTLGGVKDSEPEKRHDITRTETLRTENPLISLFGASTPWLASKLMVGHAIPSYPLSQPFVIPGVRSNDFARNPEQLKFLPPDDVGLMLEEALLNQQRSHLKQELATLEKSIKKRDSEKNSPNHQKLPDDGSGPPLEERIEQIQQEIQEINEKSQFTVSVGMPLSGYEAIPQNTQMTQRIILRNVTPVELSLFLQALDQFALDPIIGSQASTGCGMISAQWTVRQQQPKAPAQSDGQIHLIPYEGIQVSSPTLKQHYGDFSSAAGYNFNSPKEGGDRS
jgi:hypothetical protein